MPQFIRPFWYSGAIVDSESQVRDIKGSGPKALDGELRLYVQMRHRNDIANVLRIWGRPEHDGKHLVLTVYGPDEKAVLRIRTRINPDETDGECEGITWRNA